MSVRHHGTNHNRDILKAVLFPYVRYTIAAIAGTLAIVTIIWKPLFSDRCKKKKRVDSETLTLYG